MIFKAELNNAGDVLKWYEARENPCFIICTGVKLDSRQIFSKWLQEESGREKLETALEFITNNINNYNTYTIVSFPYEEGIESIKIKDVEGEMIRFQFHTSYSSSQTIGTLATTSLSESKANDYGRELLLMMQKQNELMMQKFESLQYQFEMQKQLEEEEEEEEDEDPQQPTGKERLIGALAGIVEKPEFMETMFGLVGMALQKFMPSPSSNPGHNENNNDNEQ